MSACPQCNSRRAAVTIAEGNVGRLARRLAVAAERTPQRAGHLKELLDAERASLAQSKALRAQHEADCQVLA